MYQFSWRVPTVPLAFDVDVTICKPFYLWKKQSKESGPDRLVLGSELQTDFYLWNGLNLITGTVIQAMFPGWAGDKPAVLLALRAHMGMRAHSCAHNPPPTHTYSLRENAISTIVTGEPQSGDIFCKGQERKNGGDFGADRDVASADLIWTSCSPTMSYCWRGIYRRAVSCDPSTSKTHAAAASRTVGHAPAPPHPSTANFSSSIPEKSSLITLSKLGASPTIVSILRLYLFILH